MKKVIKEKWNSLDGKTHLIKYTDGTIVRRDGIILAGIVPDKKPINQGKKWSKEMDMQVINMYVNQNMKAADVAKEMGRTRAGITSRLVRLGIISERQDAR